MWLIPGLVLGIIYAITSDGHPNGLFLLAIIVTVIGGFLEFRASGKAIDRIVVETLDMAAQPPRLLGHGSFELDEQGQIRNLVVDGITVDEEGNITDASPEAMAILFEIFDLVTPPKEDS